MDVMEFNDITGILLIFVTAFCCINRGIVLLEFCY